MPKIREYPEASLANNNDALILDSEEGTKYIKVSNLLGPLSSSSTVDRLTASGSVARFEDGGDNAPIKSVLVHIEPVQEGSGDPSPDNVRPITGWTGCVISHSGADMTNPTTYSITFPAEAGTVYGGMLDVTSGVLTVDKKKYTLTGTEWWSVSSVVANRYLTPQQDAKKEYGGIKKCTHFLPTAGTGSKEGTCNVDINGTYARLFFDTNFNNLDDWKSYLAAQNDAGTPLEAVALLATPITYHLTPQEITSLLGTNNLWADTGNSDVEYRADTKMYIDRKVAELQALIIENEGN